MDAKTNFLNGNIEEDTYMDKSKGFEPKDKVKVCKLKRSIYGLKQMSRSWNRRFNEDVRKYSFAKNEGKLCMYKRVSGSKTTFLVLYMDDILLNR